MNALDVFAAAHPDVEVDDGTLDAIAADVFDGVPRSQGALRTTIDTPPAAADRPHSAWLLAGAAAAIVALVVGLLVVGGGRGADAPAVPPTAMPPVEPLRLLPADPTPYSFAGSVRPRWTNPVGQYVVLARPDGAGGFSDPIWVSRSPRDQEGLDRLGSLVDFDVGGRPMQFHEDVSTGYRLVEFEVGDGTDLSLVAFRQGPAGTFRDELGAIVLAIDVATPELSLSAPPVGYDVVATGEYGQEPIRSLDVQRSERSFAALSTVVSSDTNFPLLNMGEHIEPATVRGKAGWLTTSTWQTDDGPWVHQRLIWEEQPGQWVQVGTGDRAVDLEELGAVRGLAGGGRRGCLRRGRRRGHGRRRRHSGHHRTRAARRRRAVADAAE